MSEHQLIAGAGTQSLRIRSADGRVGDRVLLLEE